ncbi:MAG: GNAT family N-acetyltransferase [Candidatus Gracilibacteria bacterium]|nr:GNAT family N-acetyltransferase [Candidatus Gracilibacteria bacterium]MDD3119970.1 GNAT family N-acetyltransferase [Candidatus Gracilibacteria bacterium]
MIKTREYSEKDYINLIECVEKLQDHIISVDNLGINIRSPEYGEYYTNNFLKKIKENQGIIYVVYDEEKMIGFIGFIIEESCPEDKYEIKPIKIGRVSELFVNENYRGKKIGHSLINLAEDYFNKNNCNLSRIEVFVPNKIAYDFYHRLGYEDRIADVSKTLKT